MIKLMQLELKKLKHKSVISEVVIYLLILLFIPLLFIKVVSSDFGQNYATFLELNTFIQMGFVLFGASLINQVFIEEYKNKTISLSFSYPLSRKKLFAAKILFIAAFVFICTVFSFFLTGVITYLIDQVYPIISGGPTSSDFITFFSQMIFHSLKITLICFIPLFYFAIWKRATVLTVICAIVAMQSHVALIFNVNYDLVMAVLIILGSLSIFLSITTAEKIGEI